MEKCNENSYSLATNSCTLLAPYFEKIDENRRKNMV